MTLLREAAIRLPAGLDGKVENFEVNPDNEEGAYILFAIIDELQEEITNGCEGSRYSKTSLLQAWHEHRLFGLRMQATATLDNTETAKRTALGSSPCGVCTLSTYLWKNTLARTQTTHGHPTQYMFPLFCVVRTVPTSKHSDQMNCIESLWVAQRARGVGLGRRIVAEMNCWRVSRVQPKSTTFWHKMGYILTDPPPEKNTMQCADPAG